MVRVHRITPELADYHVSQMQRLELLQRFRYYAGMELSAQNPSERSGEDARMPDLSQKCSRVSA